MAKRQVAELDDNPRDDELDEEEESPFRRPRPVQVRRRRVSPRGRRMLKGALIALAVLVPVGYVSYQAASYALHSPRFRLNSPADVVVQGNQYVSRQEVLSALGLPLTASPDTGVNIFRVRLDALRQRVESISWVRSASVARAYPHQLIVSIVERTPVAFINTAGRVKLVDADGVVLEKPEHGNFAFPVVEGLDGVTIPADRRARLALYRQFMQELSDGASTSGWLVSEVDLSDSDDLKAVMVQGQETILVHFGHQDFASRFQDFLTLLPDLRKANAKIYSVDLRYRNQVVVSPEPPKGGAHIVPDPSTTARK